MATAAVSNTPNCSICLESFKTPKILPCGHTFCLVCIEGYIGDKTETFHCPICQQGVKIPEGGAKEFTTNYIAIDKQLKIQPEPPSTTQPRCPNHKQREVDYYCNNCNVGLCLKCILGQHKDHETLDIECDETRKNSIEKLERSQKIIQNKIKNLKKTRSALLESLEQLKSLCEDSCAKVTEQTERIVSDLRKGRANIIKDMTKNLDENRSKVEDRVMEITRDIYLLESNMDSIISTSTKTTLNILQKLPCLIEIEKLDESRNDYNLCLHYLEWERDYFSLDIYQLGSVISKPFYLPGWSQFLFDVSDIKEYYTDYYSKNKFRYNNLVWSCRVQKLEDDYLLIDIQLLPDDNPKLDYCNIDCQLSLLNIKDDRKTKTKKFCEVGLNGGNMLTIRVDLKRYRITWSKLTDKNNGYLNSKGQFVIQFDITQFREI